MAVEEKTQMDEDTVATLLYLTRKNAYF